MSLTAAQATSLLSQITTTQGLRDLIKQISVEATGKTTILYSGPTVGSNSDNARIINGMLINGEDIRVIDKTEAAKFLDVFDTRSPTYNKALVAKFEQLGLGEVDQFDSAANEFLFGKTADGQRISTGAWDDVSAKFVSETVGEVRTLTGGASDQKIFAQTEVPAILNNSKITSVDGIQRVDLVEKGPTGAFAAIKAQSEIYSAELRVARNADGSLYIGSTTSSLMPVDARKFFEATGVEGKASAIPLTNATNLGQYMPDRLSDHTTGAKVLQEIKAKYEVLATSPDLPGVDNSAVRSGALKTLNKLGWAGDFIALGFVVKDANAAYSSGNKAAGDKIVKDWAIDFAGGLAGGLSAAKLTASALAPLYLAGPAGAVIAGGLTLIAGVFGGILGSMGATALSDTFSNDTGAAGLAGATPPRRDPLALDLDCDGIETLGTQDGVRVLFDHDADGVKTGTGWLRPDDGWLVFDKNGNGTIDSGRELFGVDTMKKNGALATDGFDALADHDANADGVINSSDQVFANLKIWRDLNQDGISQSGELFALSALGITSIGVTSNPTNRNLGNGNVETATGAFTRSNGTTGATSETSGAAVNLDLLVDSFYSEFTDKIALTDQAKALFDLKGAGRVRNLSEAISLSADLGNLVASYATQTTRQNQLNLLDSFVEKWSSTSAMKSLQQQADSLSAKGVSVTYRLEQYNPGTAAYTQFMKKLGIVEKFMGFTYAGPGGQARNTPLDETSGSLTVNLSAPQISSIELAYERLKTDIHEALLLQTRYKKYADLIDIAVSGDQLALEFSTVQDSFKAAISANPQEGLIELIEFASAVGIERLHNARWNVIDFIADQFRKAPVVQAFETELKAYAVHLLPAGAPTEFGTAKIDLTLGSSANDQIQGRGGNDLLFGKSGNDYILGDEGDDRLEGGLGNDYVAGGTGNDTYVFGKGDGQDTIVEDYYETNAARVNTLLFKTGVLPTELNLQASGSDLVIKINGTT
ncbi:hypothetical protein NQT62_04985, partial [Limnobacter humi]|nr:hypothetical protein [Limnobacter humi]